MEKKIYLFTHHEQRHYYMYNQKNQCECYYRLFISICGTVLSSRLVILREIRATDTQLTSTFVHSIEIIYE